MFLNKSCYYIQEYDDQVWLYISDEALILSNVRIDVFLLQFSEVRSICRVTAESFIIRLVSVYRNSAEKELLSRVA